MRTVVVYRDAYARLVQRYERVLGRQSDKWEAIFSCNQYDQVWPSYAFGQSQPDDRHYVHAPTKLLRQLVEIVRDNRYEGGRFFIDRRGVFVNPEGDGERQIVQFDWRVGRFG